MKVNTGVFQNTNTKICKLEPQNTHYEEYQEVSEFKYLSSLVTFDNGCGEEVRARITARNRCYQAVSKIMKSRYISKYTKLKVCNAVIKPVVLCGSETWEMAEQMKSSLKTWEWKILRKIYGPTEDHNGWRIRTNVKLQVMCRKPNVVTRINVIRLE